MNKILYNSKPLFSATGNGILILGTVSLQPVKDLSPTTLKIKELYQPVFEDYAVTTELYRKKRVLNSLLGKCYWFGYDSCKQRVALIYVSKKYGRWQDPLVTVTKRTMVGMEQLLSNLPCTFEVHCEKLNSANFGVPWVDTEKELNNLLLKFPKHKIVVHA